MFALNPTLPKGINVMCKISRGKRRESKKRPFSVRPNVTVKKFRDDVATTLGVPANRVQLKMGDKVMQDKKSLAQYGVKNGSVVNVMVLSGHGMH